MSKLYFVQQEAVYLHGVYYITYSLKDAIEKANHLARGDIDDHHSWVVYEYTECNEEGVLNHIEHYCVRKGEV